MSDHLDTPAKSQIKQIVQRIEKLEEDKKAVSEDMKEVYAEAKANGFDPKIMKKLVSMRKKDHSERQEEDAILELYLNALDMPIPSDAGGDASGSVAADQLKSYIERVERLEEDKKTIADDIKEVYAEAKANGFDVKALRKVIAMRKRDRNDLQEENAITSLYAAGLGMH